jgi:hypothetical protein
MGFNLAFKGVKWCRVGYGPGDKGGERETAINIHGCLTIILVVNRWKMILKKEIKPLSLEYNRHFVRWFK